MGFFLRLAWAFSLWMLCCLPAFAQPVAFDVPAELTFAGQRLSLSPGAQAVVRKHGQMLVRNPKYYRSMTERADAYFPLIERTFRENGLPDDFKYLVIQESGLTSDVTSRSNAVGYWQFKAETATELGLRVDPEVDERLNILASSRAAAKYITKNNQYLNNWIFALLSYYAGLGGCRALVRADQMGATEMELDTTTHFYILKFLAHKLAFEQAVNRSPNPNLTIAEYAECEGKTLRQIAAETNVDPTQVEFYNKWCRTGIIPTDRDYTVIIPVVGGQQPSWMAMTTRPTPVTLGENLKPYKERYFFGLIEKEPEPTDPSLNAEAPVFFRWNGIKAILARKTDNINKLALAAGVSREDLMDYNDLRVFDLIVPGQVYYVKSKRRKAKVPFHTVRQGETLWEVAQNYGITLEAILRKNRMKTPEKLTAGRILWLRHIRPSDHPVEFDPNVKAAPMFPATKPLPPPMIASTGPAPASVVVISSSPAIRKDPSAPTTQELTLKYEDVQTNDKAEQITVPLSTGDSLPEDSKLEEVKPLPSPPTSSPKTSPSQLPTSSPKPSPPHLPTSSPNPSHTVQPKETIYAISRQYGIPVADLKAANPGMIEAGLQPGMVLTLPTTLNLGYLKDLPTSSPTPPSLSHLPTSSPSQTHTVAPGETFYSISRKYNLKVEDLKTLNGLGDAPLSVGQLLKVK